MNRYLFAARNLRDKLGKMTSQREVAGFYFRTYVLSRLDRVRPTAYVVSYPKCGRTWVRFLLARYAQLLGNPSRIFNDRGLLSISADRIVKFEHGQGTWVPAPCLRESLTFDHQQFSGANVLFLVRDPRDVLVSSWYHLRFRENIYREDLATFIRDDLVGIEKVVAFMNLWMENAAVPGAFQLIHYEHLRREPEENFHRVLEQVGLQPVDKVLKQAVQDSEFKKMKEHELRGSLKEPWMKPGAGDLGHSLKVRKGLVGGFRQEFSKEDIAYLDGVMKNKLDPKLQSLWLDS